MAAAKSVLITGVSSGIGRETALAFAQRGFHVAGTARREDRLTQLKAEIEALNSGDFLPLVADVRDADAMQDATAAAFERFGRLDVLVVNAGVGHRGAIVDSEWDGVETLLRTNIDGMLHTIRAGVPYLQQTGDGHVILVSSVVRSMTTPYAAYYAASKAFMTSIANALRLELEPQKVRVTEVVIGRTATEFSEKRLGAAGRSGGGLPVMPPTKVAEAIVGVIGNDRDVVTLRWIDRLMLLGNALVPKWIGRRALKQYK